MGPKMPLGPKLTVGSKVKAITFGPNLKKRCLVHDNQYQSNSPEHEKKRSKTKTNISEPTTGTWIGLGRREWPQ